MKLRNKYYIMRHGQAISNVKEIVSCWPERFQNPLTKHGREQVKAAALKIKEKSIDLIFCSPILRTKQTAEIVGGKLKIKPRVDKRLVEQNAGIFNGQSLQSLISFFGEKTIKRFTLRPKKGETYIEIERRMVGCLKAIDRKYKGKNILIISHELPLLFLDCAVKGISNKDFYTKREKINTAEFKELN